MKRNNEVNIGIIGLGTVGCGVIELLQQQEALLYQRTGKQFKIKGVSATSRSKKRPVDISSYPWFDDPLALAQDPNIDIIVELVGGSEGVAKDVTLAALKSDHHVVTANKALLAHMSDTLLQLSETTQKHIGFEAAVAGGIPIIQTLREGLVANKFSQIYGILNGTCNYILTEMYERGIPFANILKEAQEQGYAELDPSFDIDGIDTAHKLTILAGLAFGAKTHISQVYVEGIRHIDVADIIFADEMGYKIKLLGWAELINSRLSLRVLPCFIKNTTPIARVDGVLNAVVPIGDFVATSLYEGPGAGGKPTASSVVSDIIGIAQKHHYHPPFVVSHKALQSYALQKVEDDYGMCYLRLMVKDEPGVLADITAIMRDHHMSCLSMVQKGRSLDKAVPIFMVMHECNMGDVYGALEKMRALPSVLEKPVMIRIMDF